MFPTTPLAQAAAVQGAPSAIFNNPIAQLGGVNPFAALAAAVPSAALAASSPVLNSIFNPALNPQAALLQFNPAAAPTLALTGGVLPSAGKPFFSKLGKPFFKGI